MVADRSEHEPDEYDPEAEFRDPDSDSITIPRVSTEDAGSTLRDDLRSERDDDATGTPDIATGDTDVSADLLKDFWALVLVLNAAILSVALGLLFLFFEGATYGAYLLGAGLVLAGFAVRRYRTARRRNDSDPTVHDTDPDASDESLEERDDDEAPADTDSEAPSVRLESDDVDDPAGPDESTERDI